MPPRLGERGDGHRPTPLDVRRLHTDTATSIRETPTRRTTLSSRQAPSTPPKSRSSSNERRATIRARARELLPEHSIPDFSKYPGSLPAEVLAISPVPSSMRRQQRRPAGRSHVDQPTEDRLQCPPTSPPSRRRKEANREAISDFAPVSKHQLALKRMARAERAAAIKLQAAERRREARREVNRRLEAAVLIQSRARGLQHRRVARRLSDERQEQRRIAADLEAKRQLEERCRRAALPIQAAHRGRVARVEFHGQRAAAIALQASARRRLARTAVAGRRQAAREQAARHAAQEQAAIRLQAAARRRAAVRSRSKAMHALFNMQFRARRLLARLRVRRRAAAAVRIQSRLRGQLDRRAAEVLRTARTQRLAAEAEARAKEEAAQRAKEEAQRAKEEAQRSRAEALRASQAQKSPSASPPGGKKSPSPTRKR